MSFSSAFSRFCPVARKVISCGRAWSGEVVSPATAAFGLYFVCRSKFSPAEFNFIFCCGFARQNFFKEPEKMYERPYYPSYIVFNEVTEKKNAFRCVGGGNNLIINILCIISRHKNCPYKPEAMHLVP